MTSEEKKWMEALHAKVDKLFKYGHAHGAKLNLHIRFPDGANFRMRSFNARELAARAKRKAAAEGA